MQLLKSVLNQKNKQLWLFLYIIQTRNYPHVALPLPGFHFRAKMVFWDK